MEDKEIRISQLAGRMRDFGEAQAAGFPPASVGGQKFAELDALVTEIEQSGSQQTLARASVQSSTDAKRDLKTSIRSQLKAMRNTAVSLEPEQPGISSMFRMPVGSGSEVLINTARAYIEAATPLKALFISREMPATFLDDLAASITQLEEKTSHANQHRANRTAATASLKAALSRVLELRRELDPIVRNKFRNDPATLAAWASASHLERAPKKASAPKATSPQP